MACKSCSVEPVWKFTNQTHLCRNCFKDYVERKVFRTIRKYNMLPSDKLITLKKDSSLNTAVLKAIIEKKFPVKFSGKPNFSSNNLSIVAEKIFSNITKGDFSGPKPKDTISRPLYFLSDNELELYARLKKIAFKQRKKDDKVQSLLKKFSKNPDIEHNIISAFLQI